VKLWTKNKQKHEVKTAIRLNKINYPQLLFGKACKEKPSLLPKSSSC
jgi:hypothetical protein